MMLLDFDAFSIYEVEDAYKKLLELYNKEQNISLDFNKIQKIDASAIQLLLSLQFSLAKHSKTLEIKNMNEDVKTSLSLCGCDVLLLGANND